MTVPYTFGTATTSIPLSNLDANFNTPITLGNTSIYLGNTTTTIGNLTLTNVTISSGTANITSNITYATANAVVYTNSSNVGITSSSLKFDGTNFGIGVSNPSYLLDVQSSDINGVVANLQATAANTYGTLRLTGNNRGGEIDFYNGSTAQTSIVGGTGNLYFYTNGNSSLKATLDSSGSLLVGTTTVPTTGGLARSVVSFKQLNDSGTSANIIYSSGIQLEANGNTNVLSIGYDGSSFGFNASYRTTGGYVPIAFWTSGNERLRIDISGNVGINTTSPSSYVSGLAVAGSTANSGDIALVKTNSGTANQGGQALRLFNYGPAATGRNSGTVIGSLYWLASQPSSGGAQDAAWIQCVAESQSGVYTPSQLTFWTAGTSIQKAMTIDSQQNVLINVTNTAHTSAGFTVENGGIPYVTRGAGGTFMGFYDTSASLIGSITSSGGVATLYNTTSDQRLKTNIVDAPLGNIDEIKVRSFDWIADNSHQEYGVVAQELLEVAPYAVYQPENPDEMMAVDYSKLVPMMIKEIQDLKTRLTALESK